MSAPNHREALHAAADMATSDEYEDQPHNVNLAAAYLELRREAEKLGWTPKDGE